MLRELLDTLTAEQRAQLKEYGIDRMLLWKWREGKQLPTEVKLAVLADITGTSYAKLQAEVTLARAKTPEEKATVMRALGKALAGVLPTLSFGYGAAVPPAGARGTTKDASATMYIRRRPKRAYR